MTIQSERQPRRRPYTHEEETNDVVAPDDYFGVTSNGKPLGVFRFDGLIAWKVGESGSQPRGWVSVPIGSTLVDAFNASRYGLNQPILIHRMKLPPGAYYHQIARPNDQHPEEAPGYCQSGRYMKHKIADSVAQMRSVIDRLELIVRTVHPSDKNLDCFGTEIRNLIIQSCTECEAQWRGILKCNGYQPSKSNLSTRDYVKLNPAMRLNEYAVRYQRYPWLGDLTPYAGWKTPAQPTKGLPWYDAYNATKHDREGHFERATLHACLHAVAACWVNLCAQFGFPFMTDHRDLASYFQFTAVPRWRYSDIYTQLYADHQQNAGPVNYPFL